MPGCGQEGCRQEGETEGTCKPGSVAAGWHGCHSAADGHLSRAPIARRLKRPTRESIAGRTGPRRTATGPPAPCLALLRVGFAEPVESPRLLVSSYLTVSPLPRAIPGGAARGGLLSVALSLASRPVGVTDHPVLRSPDFPLVCPVGRPATVRSPRVPPLLRYPRPWASEREPGREGRSNPSRGKCGPTQTGDHELTP